MELTTMLTFVFIILKLTGKLTQGVDMGAFSVLDFISTASYL